MIGAIYVSYVVPLAFLILVIKGEARGLILSFAWGMSSALAVYGITGLISEDMIAVDAQLAFVIPALEELVKMLPLFFMLFKTNKSYKYSLSRYALAIGLGFSILENSLYLSMLQSGGGSMPMAFTLMRSLTASLLHGSTTALVGFCFQQMLNHRFFSFVLSFGIWLGAGAIHSLYNLLWISSRYALWAIVLPLAVFAFITFGINGFGIASVESGRSNKEQLK